VIIGVGVDLVSVRRMERSLQSAWARRFKERVFTREEMDACDAGPNPAQRYAARFAAKEALAKALGTGFTRGVTPARILVHGGEREQPRITLTDKALDVARSMNAATIHVSLTHTDETACAFVVVEIGGHR